MKYLLNKYVFFVAIFIAVFLLDIILFQLIFSQLLDRYPSNVTLGMVLLAICFIVVPLATAHYVVIYRHQGQLTAEQKRKVSHNRKITIGLILAVLLLVVLQAVIQGRFSPYKFQPVTDKEFTKALKILVSKKIGENEYYLKENQQNGVSLYQQEGDNREDDRFILDLALNPKTVTDFWYDSSTNITFGIESRNNFGSVSDQIFKFSPNKTNPLGIPLDVSLLGLYPGSNKIIDYFSGIDTLLLQNIQAVWLLVGKEEYTLQSLSERSLDESRYGRYEFTQSLGYDAGLLYFAVFNSTRTIDRINTLNKIYMIDPRTKVRTTIADIDLPDNIVDVKLSKKDKNISITADNGKKFTVRIAGNSKLEEASSSANSR